MNITFVNPESMSPPHGFSHAVKTRAQTTLYIAGQVGSGKDGVIQHRGDLVGQFELTLQNIKTLVEEAGGKVEHIVKMNLYSKDLRQYVSKLRELGGVYRKYFGKHFPAMTLAGVTDLYNDGALIEIEAVAVLD